MNVRCFMTSSFTFRTVIAFSRSLFVQRCCRLSRKFEDYYVFGQEDAPVVLDRFSPVLHLIQSVRDEAHRFAVTFHRSRRDAERLGSQLEQIPGVGPATVRKLLKQFGSLESVRQASMEALSAAVGPAVARKARDHWDARQRGE
jgi:excinuclease ABC subunit C